MSGSRASSKKLCFVTLRQQFSTVQCVVAAGGDVPVEMSQFVAAVPNESVVDVLARVNLPSQPVGKLLPAPQTPLLPRLRTAVWKLPTAKKFCFEAV